MARLVINGGGSRRNSTVAYVALALGFGLLVGLGARNNFPTASRVASSFTAVTMLGRAGVAASSSSEDEGCIVIVHLGDGSHLEGIPQQQAEQISDNVQQLRLFNPTLPIYVVTEPVFKFSTREVSQLLAANATFVDASELPVSPDMEKWLQGTPVTRNDFRNHFMQYTSQRFFYLSAIAQQLNLTNIVHIEYDNLIYIDLRTILPVLQRYYNVGAVFDSPPRAVPGFTYFRTAQDTVQLSTYFAEHAADATNDMVLFSHYHNAHPDRVTPLPIFDPKQYPDPVDVFFATHVDDFKVIFDAAALGQHLGGVDPRNFPDQNTTGFVNTESVVKTDKMHFEWKREGGLWRPFVDGLPIVNLHIHSKHTARWRSDRADA